MSKKKIINPLYGNGEVNLLRGGCFVNYGYRRGPVLPSITCKSSNRFFYPLHSSHSWGFRIKLASILK